MLQSVAINKNNISIRVYDIEPFIKQYDINNIKITKSLSHAVYYKIFIPELLKEYHKVLYLDCDTIILDDITNLYHTDITNYYVAAVKNYFTMKDINEDFIRHIQQNLQMKDVSEYFNAGVLLLNLDLIRHNFSFPFLLEQAKQKGGIMYDAQDVLNSIFYQKVSFLPPKYNFSWKLKDFYFLVKDGSDALDNPAIIHYTGQSKPWEKDGLNTDNNYDSYFWRFAAKCPYTEELRQICHAYTEIYPAFDNGISIVFCGDENIIIPIFASIQSIIDNTSNSEKYDIIIVANKFIENYNYMFQSMIINKKNISIRVYNIEPFLKMWDMSKIKNVNWLSFAAYYRLFLPELLKKYHKVLYLDCDTIILEDIANLYHTDVTNYYAAAVIVHFFIRSVTENFKKFIQDTLLMKDASEYFNSGVLLLNLDLIRHDFSFPFLLEQIEQKGGIMYDDQDVLNSIFYKKVRFLPIKYNFMRASKKFYFLVDGGLEALKHPAIIHYGGSNMKPWKKNGILKGREYDIYFWKYAAKSPYADKLKQICQQYFDVSGYKKRKINYLRCLILSYILLGKKRRHYKEKSHAISCSLKETELFMVRRDKILFWD